MKAERPTRGIAQVGRLTRRYRPLGATLGIEAFRCADTRVQSRGKQTGARLSKDLVRWIVFASHTRSSTR